MDYERKVVIECKKGGEIVLILVFIVEKENEDTYDFVIVKDVEDVVDLLKVE